MITIKRGNATVIVVQPLDTVVQQKEISAGNFVSLSFELPVYVEFERMDTAEILGETYYLTQLPSVQKSGNRYYTYILGMEGEQCKLGRVEFLQSNSIGQYFKNPFFINDKPETFMTLLLRNIERVFPGEGWKLGYVEDGEVKNISFNGQNCLEALNMLADQFDTEWLVEGRTIHLYRKQNATGLVMKRGLHEALYSIDKKPQDNGNIVTRLYVYGSSKNLPYPYRNGLERLTIGTIPYIEKYVEQFGIWEDSITFEDIMPKNLGKVTAVDASNPLKFTDANIPFNVNDNLMDGVTAKIAFETGQLSGYEFEIDSYNNTTKTFVINKNTKETSLDIPSALISPAAGDEYFVFDIRMPESFTLSAEAQLKQKGFEHMDQRNDPEETQAFTVECNPLFFKSRSMVLKLADSVTLQDADMNIDTQKRIVKLTRNVRQPHIYTCELANRPKKNVMVKLLENL